MMKRMLDLFAGLGGASEGFLLMGWDVVRFDNNELLKDVPHTIIADLLKPNSVLENYGLEPDLIWASPPCTDFSLAFNAPGPKAIREGEIFEPDLEPLRLAIRVIREKKPKYWVIENVAGASKIFSQELGVNAPRQIIGPYFLWGNFPYLPENLEFEREDKTKIWEIENPLRANLRGKIPIEISVALCKAITEQKQLSEWII